MYVVCISYLYSYTAEKRDVLGYSSLTIKRFSRAKHDGNLEVRGDAYCINQCIPTRGHSLIINTSLARDVSGNTSIQRDVKINSSPIMTRECFICLVRVAISPKEVFHVLVPGDAGQSEEYTYEPKGPNIQVAVMLDCHFCLLLRMLRVNVLCVWPDCVLSVSGIPCEAV